MAKFSGELPPELVKEIHELSKPAFTYFREYNRALRVLNKPEWIELREKLCGKDREKVCVALNRFFRAFDTREKAEKLLEAYMFSIGIDPHAIAVWDHETQSVRGPVLTQEQQQRKGQWFEVVGRALAQQRMAQRLLMVEGYGEDLVSWQEMMNRRANRFGSEYFGY